MSNTQKKKKASEVIQVVECLPSKCEALEFKPSITTHTKKKKKKKERKKKKKRIGL
jgi:hypothetical protein